MQARIYYKGYLRQVSTGQVGSEIATAILPASPSRTQTGQLILVAGRCRVCPMARDLPCRRNESYDAQRMPVGSKCRDPPCHSATIAQLHFRRRCGFSKFIPPKRRFWKDEQMMKPRMVEELFKGVSTLFGLRTIEKSVEKPDFIICSSFQNLRLGSIKLLGIKLPSIIRPKTVSEKLCSPNEDFGRPNQPFFRLHFRRNFQRFVAQIEYSRP